MSQVTNRTVLQRYRTCPVCGKRGYEKKEYAKKHARQMANGMKPYRCGGSGLWHDGHRRPGMTRQDYRELAAVGR